MSILKDVVDIMKDINSTGIADNLIGKKASSLSKISTEGTLQFPVLITRSLDVSTLNTICSALERQYASFAQIAMTMDPIANAKEGGRGYIRKFHQNTGIKYNATDAISDVSRMAQAVGESTGCEVVIESVVATGATIKVKVDNKEQLTSVLESLEPATLNSLFKPLNIAVMEAKEKSFDKAVIFNVPPGSGNDSKITATTHSIEEKRVSSTTSSGIMDRKVFNSQNVLKDNDVKKSNELVPTTMHIRIILTNDEGEAIDTFDFIIGVKAIMHPIKSEDMIDNVYRGCKQHGAFFNFVKWTTGEISFVKDLLLRVDETKFDVHNKSAGASHWWTSLKRRKNISKIRNNVLLPGGMLPNATIVMTMDEVDYIQTRYGYNLMDERVADKIMDIYYLLAFVVVDSSGDIVYLLFDGQTSYQSTTFDGLRRETSNQNNLNEVIKMANRLRV